MKPHSVQELLSEAGLTRESVIHAVRARWEQVTTLNSALHAD